MNDIIYCSKCNEPYTKQDRQAGLIAKIDNDYYCQPCYDEYFDKMHNSLIMDAYCKGCKTGIFEVCQDPCKEGLE